MAKKNAKKKRKGAKKKKARARVKKKKAKAKNKGKANKGKKMANKKAANKSPDFPWESEWKVTAVAVTDGDIGVGSSPQSKFRIDSTGTPPTFFITDMTSMTWQPLNGPPNRIDLTDHGPAPAERFSARITIPGQGGVQKLKLKAKPQNKLEIEVKGESGGISDGIAQAGR